MESFYNYSSCPRGQVCLQRILGTWVVNRKEHISSSVIDDLTVLADLQNLFHLRKVTMYVCHALPFIRSLGGMIISFTRVSFFSEISSPACLLKVPCTFFIPSCSRDVVFRPISRWKNCFKLVSQDKPISCYN